MSTETAAVPLTAGITALLNALARGAEGGVLDIHARSEHGLGYDHKLPRIPRGGWTYLPAFVFDLLEAGWAVQFGAAARQPGSGAEFLSLCALFTAHRIETDFKPAPGQSWKWRRDEAAAANVLRWLREFSSAPAFIIDAFKEIVALWPLAEPICALDEARRLQRRLAELLGAATQQVTLRIPSTTTAGGSLLETPADDPLAYLPMPGSIIRELGSPPPVVTFAAVAPDRSYPLAEIEAALSRKGAAS